MKKIKIFGCIVLALVVLMVVLISITNCILINRYHTDIEQMTESFPSLDGIERCYWKDRNAFVIGLGPNDYYMEGFLVLSDDKTEELLNLYEWLEVEIDFTEEKGELQIDPEITGFSDFTWVYNNEFSEMVTSHEFWMGDFVFDPNNGILCFDVSTF